MDWGAISYNGSVSFVGSEGILGFTYYFIVLNVDLLEKAEVFLLLRLDFSTRQCIDTCFRIRESVPGYYFDWFAKLSRQVLIWTSLKISSVCWRGLSIQKDVQFDIAGTLPKLIIDEKRLIDTIFELILDHIRRD